MINFLTCDLDLTSTSFSDINIITYEIELSPARKKITLNLLDYKDFNTPHIPDTITKLSVDHQITTQDKNNV